MKAANIIANVDRPLNTSQTRTSGAKPMTPANDQRPALTIARGRRGGAAAEVNRRGQEREAEHRIRDAVEIDHRPSPRCRLRTAGRKAAAGLATFSSRTIPPASPSEKICERRRGLRCAGAQARDCRRTIGDFAKWRLTIGLGVRFVFQS
jgi:hypothetical protein